MYYEADLEKEEWLLQRLRGAKPNLNPEFALNATVNWARALALHCAEKDYSPEFLIHFYDTVQPRNPKNEEGDTLACTAIFMALQNVSALTVMRDAEKPVDLIRSAIITWYYGIYNAASAMVEAADGSSPKNHKSTAAAWDRQIAQEELIPAPFCWRLSSLVERTYSKEAENLRDGNKFNLTRVAQNKNDARGACLSYLKGTANHERKECEEVICRSKEFNQRFQNFRKKEARQLRDERLKRKSVCFLHQAFRYRNKANYQDALYLGYGKRGRSNNLTRLQGLIADLCLSSNAFLQAASYYCSRRLGKSLWTEFIEDIENNSQLEIFNDAIFVEWKD